jgi:hypothetical protein
MATKQVVHYGEAHTLDAGDILLEIDGLIANADGTFVLRGVKPVNLHYEHMQALRDAMIDQGVDRRIADRLSDEALLSVHTGLLADALAQRTKRVG